MSENRTDPSHNQDIDNKDIPVPNWQTGKETDWLFQYTQDRLDGLDKSKLDFRFTLGMGIILFLLIIGIAGVVVWMVVTPLQNEVMELRAARATDDMPRMQTRIAILEATPKVTVPPTRANTATLIPTQTSLPSPTLPASPTPTPKPPTAEPIKPNTSIILMGTINGASVRYRSTPNNTNDNNIVGSFKSGDKIQVKGISQDSRWYQLADPFLNNWVFVDFVNIQGDPKTLPVIPPGGGAPASATMPTATVMPSPTTVTISANPSPISFPPQGNVIALANLYSSETEETEQATLIQGIIPSTPISILERKLGKSRVALEFWMKTDSKPENITTTYKITGEPIIKVEPKNEAGVKPVGKIAIGALKEWQVKGTETEKNGQGADADIYYWVKFHFEGWIKTEAISPK